MRQITDHHDGHGLNEAIAIEADEFGPGGASHHYSAKINGELVADVQFQKGPRNEPDSTPGLTEAGLLAIVLDRLNSFQQGPFACRENAIAATHVESALLFARRRADNRAKRGVLGKSEK